MTAHHNNASGDWVTREVPGAQCLEDWKEAWEFAVTGFVMSGTVDKGVAEAYGKMFAAMAKQYPRSWWICCMAEWECRFEWAPEELRRQRQFDRENPGLATYNEAKKWTGVLMSAIKGIEAITFWEPMKEKARSWEASPRSHSHPSWVDKQVGLYNVNSTVGLGGPAPRLPVPKAPGVPGEPGLGKKGAKKRAAAEARQLAGQQRPQPGAQPPPQPHAIPRNAVPGHPRKKPDGTYVTGYCGTELCFEWGRNEAGCCLVGPCKGVKKRLHGCEVCLGQHRSIN